MATRQGSVASVVPIAIAAMLIAACVTGARLYTSSTTSAALDEQLASTCRTRTALSLPIPTGRPDAETTVKSLGATLSHVVAPRRGAIAKPALPGLAVIPTRITLIWLEGAATNVNPRLAPLGFGEIALAESYMAEMSLSIGDSITLKDDTTLTVTQSFDVIPFAPIPEFWCGFPKLFEPTDRGDLPPPYAIASIETIQSYGDLATTFDEYQVTPEPLTLTEGDDLLARHVEVTAAWERQFASTGLAVPHNELARVVTRAHSVRVTVSRNLAPVLLTGLVADLVVLIAAAVLVARERRRELRLLAVRGVHPIRVALTVGPGLTIALMGGAVVGWLGAYLGVREFGPSSLFESTALRGSLVDVAVAVVLASIVVAAVVAGVGDGYVDPRPRRRRLRLPQASAMVAISALAVVAFRRLDEHGGVRAAGITSTGGDLLAMGFPLFAVLATVSVAVVLIAGITPALRLTGSRLNRAIRLGWRRVVLEPGPLAAIIASVALASGCFTVATTLTQAADQQLDDKAHVYVGADLAVTLYDAPHVPDDWQMTLVSRTRVKWNDTPTDLLGVDPETFADVALLRSDASPKSMSELLDDIADTGPDGAINAIAVGADARPGDTHAVTAAWSSVSSDVTAVDTMTFFPGKTTSIPMIVVVQAQFDRLMVDSRTIMLIRDPPEGAVQIIHDGGTRTGVVLDAATAFDGSSYSALRWANAPLAALGGLFALVALSLQLLVVAARREQRRVGHVVLVRTGFSRRSAWLAALVETGVPMIVGTVIGIAAAAGAASMAVRRLDPMPSLAPPSRFLMPWSVVTLAAVAVPIWTALVAVGIVRSTERGDPMQALRGAP